MGARLGQHFLFDPSILARIADAAIAEPTERVLEIGPGKGTLTRELAKRAAHVTSIELDRGLAAQLQRQGSDESESETGAGNVHIIQGDALKVPWPDADVICGNIPYQITSPLIERALTPPRPKRIVFLMQREVADRLTAGPGSKDYSALSAGVQLVAEVQMLFAVKAGSFRPPPTVESAVVRLVPRSTRLVDSDAEELRARELIRLLFQRRRQQIQRSIRELVVPHNHEPSTISHQLVSVGLEPAARPEVLSPQQFVMLARLFPTT